MGQETKDETRWLTRLFAVFFIVLGVLVMVRLPQRFFSGQLPFDIMVISLAISVLFFWIGYRLWITSSFWNIIKEIFSCIPGSTLIFLYLQSQYFKINKHIRSGLVAGVILLIVQVLLFFMRGLYNDFQFCKWIVRISQRIFWPPRDWIEILSFSQWLPLAQVLFVVFYIFAIGFVIGTSLSYLIGWTVRKQTTPPSPRLENSTDE